MITLPLNIERVSKPAHAPAAWFIAGTDPAVWLAELSLWQVPLAKVRLFILPASSSNREAGGALAIISGAAPRSVQRAEAYGCVAGKVYLPIHAQFTPPVTAAELEKLAAFDLSIFHPGVGLVGFQQRDALTVAALLAVPPRTPAQWDRAQPGASPYPRLVSVEPEVVLSLDDLMQAARGDIGSKAPETLPPQPGEGSPLLDKAKLAGLGAAAALGGILGGIGAGLGSLMGGLGGLGGLGGGLGGGGGASAGGGKAGARGPGLFDAFKEWARAQARQISDRLESARNREIDRLMRMLDNDPDNGLSYAIPLAGKAGQHRGVATPGSRLTRRGTNFDLGSLRGGGSVDPWGLSEKLRQQLREKYIKAANRELSLGRYRRAAYIFSELLGDHGAAASALKQGRFFREAAVIYRDVLKNKALAAECLEEGGLITEAIELREQLQQWLQVARLYEKIERPDEARQAYRKAVDDALSRHDRITAARVLSDSMNEHDEALSVLARGWPESSQAELCLSAQFTLLGKLGRHGEALKVVQGLRSAMLPDARAEAAVGICAKLTGSYPDANFRTKSADIARVLAGRRLARMSSDRARVLTNAIATLAPHDRLLARDTTRYVEYKAVQERQVQKPLPRPLKVSNKPIARRLVRTIQLGHDGAQWSAAAMGCSGAFFAAGPMRFEKDRPGLLVVRGLWTGELQRECWAAAPVAFDKPLLLEAPRRASQDVIVGPSKGQRIPGRMMPASRVGLGVNVGTADWVPLDTVAFCYDEDGLGYAVRFSEQDWTLDVYSVEGQLTAQFPLAHYEGPNPAPLPMVVRNRHAFISSGTSALMIFRPFGGGKGSGGKTELIDVRMPIRGIAGSAPFTRLRVGIAFEEGGVVLWPDTAAKKQSRFGQGMINPVIGFTRGGDLVAVTKAEVRVYHTESETLVIACSTAGPGEEAYAVLPADGVDEYAIFLKNGDVQVWHV